MSVKSRIETKLTTALAPAALSVIDESDRHKGHAGSSDDGESHFRVTIVSAAFDGLSRIERHRKVQALLKDELDGSVHALALKTQTPAEAAS